MVPNTIVRNTEIPTTITVFKKPVTIFPLTKAVLKFSKFSQLFGKVKGVVAENSAVVLNAPKSTTTMGRIAAIAEMIKSKYLKKAATICCAE